MVELQLMRGSRGGLYSEKEEEGTGREGLDKREEREYERNEKKKRCSERVCERRNRANNRNSPLESMF